MTALIPELALKSILMAAFGFGIAALLARASAAVRHRLWGLTLAGMLALPMLMAALPALPLRWLAPAAPPAAATYPSVENVLATPTGSVHLARAETVAPVEGRHVSWEWAWTALWLLGFAACAARLAEDWGRLRRTLGEAAIADASELDELAARLGLRRRVGLRISSSVQVPQMGGVWRPAVLLPAGAEHWPRERRRVVLLHELAHARRGDCGWLLLARIACAAYWWNPLAWMAARRLRAAGEEACDQAALEAARREGVEAYDYATHLVAIARLVLAGAPPAPLAAAMAQSCQVEARVNALLDRRRRLGMAAALPLLAVFAVGMAPLAAVRLTQAVPGSGASSAAPAFDVVSVKPFQYPDRPWHRDARYDPQRLYIEGMSASELIKEAYQVNYNQIVGAPPWNHGDLYSVTGTTDKPATQAEMRLMLQRVLAERFHLVLDDTTRVQPVYDLVVARGGPKLKPSTSDGDCASVITSEQFKALNLPPYSMLNWVGCTTTELVEDLNAGIQLPEILPVLDKTGLTGRYAMALWRASDGSEPVPDEPGGTFRWVNQESIQSALRREMGLELVKSTGPYRVLIVKHIAVPTAN